VILFGAYEKALPPSAEKTNEEEDKETLSQVVLYSGIRHSRFVGQAKA